jgi:hypothetical protein
VITNFRVHFSASFSHPMSFTLYRHTPHSSCNCVCYWNQNRVLLGSSGIWINVAARLSTWIRQAPLLNSGHNPIGFQVHLFSPIRPFIRRQTLKYFIFFRTQNSVTHHQTIFEPFYLFIFLFFILFIYLFILSDMFHLLRNDHYGDLCEDEILIMFYINL